MQKISVSGKNYYRCNTKSCFSIRQDDLKNLVIKRIIQDISTDELSKSINRYRKTINTEIQCLNQSLQQKLKQKDKKLLEYIEEPTDSNKTASFKKLINEINTIHRKISESTKEKRS